jgi:(4S)-4-hydroxy-5-phosphonooxypentane-2,3-dione isomerase
MNIVLVRVQVKSDCIEEFKAATVENAACSIQEPGVARFDLLQESADPCRFLLVEVYRNAGAPALHKQTAHYAKWRDAVAPMMAEPRTGTGYTNIFPDDGGW